MPAFLSTSWRPMPESSSICGDCRALSYHVNYCGQHVVDLYSLLPSGENCFLFDLDGMSLSIVDEFHTRSKKASVGCLLGHDACDESIDKHG